MAVVCAAFTAFLFVLFKTAYEQVGQNEEQLQKIALPFVLEPAERWNQTLKELPFTFFDS